MKSFLKFMNENLDTHTASIPTEFVVKILVRGTDDDFNYCAEQCSWLKRTEKNPRCSLFHVTLDTKTIDGAALPVRSKICVRTTDALI